MHDRLNLDGVWKMRRDPDRGMDHGDAVHDFSWENAAVPLRLPEGPGAVWFSRRFRIPASWRGKALYLCWGGGEYAPVVWVNGHPVGRDRTGRYPLEFPVTGAIETGRENSVTVRLDCGRGVPGPWGGVHLLACGAVSVAGTGIATLPADGGDALVSVRVRLRNADRRSRSVGLTCIADVKGGTMDAAVREHRNVSLEGREAFPEIMMRIPAPELWNTHDRGGAALHTLTVMVGEHGRVLDECQMPFGIRHVCRGNDGGWLLNGRPFFVRGVVPEPGAFDVPEHDGRCRGYIRSLREAGYNAVRVDAGYRGRELYRACDREGILVWQELDGIDAADDMRAVEAARGDVRRRVELLGSHPCVAAWFTTDTDGPVAQAARGADPVRMVMAASEWGRAGDAAFPVVACDGTGAGRREFERIRLGVSGRSAGCFCRVVLDGPQPSAAPVLITFEPAQERMASGGGNVFSAVSVVNDRNADLTDAVCRVVFTAPDGTVLAEDVRTVSVPAGATVTVLRADERWRLRADAAPGTYRLTCALLDTGGRPLARNGTVALVE